jgi:hypothetical protein
VSSLHWFRLCFTYHDGSVLFASIYRFTTIMSFDMADTTGTLAVACTWCVIEIAAGIISACLPTLRPLMVLVSSQFASTLTPSGGNGTTGAGRSGNSDLIAIGGTGAPRGQPFRRLWDGHSYDMNTVANHTQLVPMMFLSPVATQSHWRVSNHQQKCTGKMSRRGHNICCQRLGRIG